MVGIMRIATPASSDDPPPSPRLSKKAFPNNLIINSRDPGHFSDLKLFADGEQNKREETYGKAAAIDDLKKVLPANILAVYFG